ncbi:MAG: TrkH family potassium uptake protein [Gammaproteobacteria bacterium]|nr:TrkH family potassium uptake protein [Gammaproteobacteria bacterium]
MHIRIAFRILASLLMMFSLTMLPPIVVAVLYADGMSLAFVETFFITLSAGAVLWLMFHRVQDEMRTKDGFLVTFLFYVALGGFGALPFIQSEGIGLSVPDAVFESFSGLTTTGATVISNIDSLPRSILFYRQQLQWLGGMGIIVLAVAILPMLGIGGMQLYRAETPGPMKDSKLTPRIKHTALALWSIYVAITALCGVAYWLAGMSMFDALCHSFSTVAIGGFSTHDASIGYFDSPLIEGIAIVFMLISGINFGLHFFAWRERSLVHYFQDDEVKFYLSILVIAVGVVSILLYSTATFDAPGSLRYAAFQVVSIFTTTGFATDDFANWPNMLPYFIFFGAFTGACAGSTGGGMKVMRVMLICKQGIREIHRLIHPHAIFPIKLNKRPVASSTVEAIWGFFAIYVITFLFMHLAMIASGMDFVTAFSAVGAAINNLGPGLGDVAVHYGDISDSAKFILCFAMMLGRLEIFTLLVLFTPMFWRK